MNVLNATVQKWHVQVSNSLIHQNTVLSLFNSSRLLCLCSRSRQLGIVPVPCNVETLTCTDHTYSAKVSCGRVVVSDALVPTTTVGRQNLFDELCGIQ